MRLNGKEKNPPQNKAKHIRWLSETVTEMSVNKTQSKSPVISFFESFTSLNTTHSTFRWIVVIVNLEAWQRSEYTGMHSHTITVITERLSFRQQSEYTGMDTQNNSNHWKTGQSDFCPSASQGWPRLWLAFYGYVVLRIKAQKCRQTTHPLQSHLCQ